LKKHIKYGKVDEWYYSISKKHPRNKVKRVRNKIIRRIDKENIKKEILYWE